MSSTAKAPPVDQQTEDDVWFVRFPPLFSFSTRTLARKRKELSTSLPPPKKSKKSKKNRNEETAPHAARDKAPNRGAPHPARQHDPHGDRHSKHGGERGMKGRSHLPAHEKKGGGSGTRGDSGGAGWTGPEKKGERELIDKETALEKLDPKDPGVGE
jgi:hypothetical protein